MRGHELRCDRRVGLKRRRMCGLTALAVGIVFGSGGIATQSALAAAAFQRGDVFLTGTGSVQEYSPTGHLQRTVPGTSGATSLCFDPSGQHLVLPGVGLFDRQGNPLPSHWASAMPVYKDCVADGFGHVYTGITVGSGYAIAQYDLEGDLIQTFAVATPTDPGGQVLAIDLAPDECTMYYEPVFGGEVGRFDVCTNTQEAAFPAGWPSVFDDLRVLPNWQVAATFDTSGHLFDTSGQPIVDYLSPPPPFADLRTMSLDPDGASLWICCSNGSVLRFDINTGTLLTQWAGIGYSPIAVYGPPLLGNSNVAPNVDSNSAGTAEAFLTRVGSSGRLSRLHVYVDSSSTATQAIVGVYSNRFGRPGVLQAQGTITNLMPGSWNYVDLPSTSVTAGQLYWIAVLGPSGGGMVSFRDGRVDGLAEKTAQHHLTALPAQWSSDLRDIRLSGAMSGYGS